MYEGGCMCLTVRCEFRVAKASINVPSPAAYPISDIRYPRLWLRTLTLSRSDAHERGLARHVVELHFKRGRARSLRGSMFPLRKGRGCSTLSNHANIIR